MSFFSLKSIVCFVEGLTDDVGEMGILMRGGVVTRRRRMISREFFKYRFAVAFEIIEGVPLFHGLEIALTVTRSIHGCRKGLDEYLE